MQIDRIEEARMTAADEGEIGALLDRAFNTDFDGMSYYQQRHHVRLTARLDGALVGHMALGLRCVRLSGRLLTTATLAEVATDPDHQGKGIASRLLLAMIEEARAMRADLIMLFGDAPIYAGNGFVPKPNPMRWLDLTDRRTNGIGTGGHDGLMILPLQDIDWDDTAELDLMGNKF